MRDKHPDRHVATAKTALMHCVARVVLGVACRPLQGVFLAVRAIIGPLKREMSECQGSSKNSAIFRTSLASAAALRCGAVREAAGHWVLFLAFATNLIYRRRRFHDAVLNR